nr:hypothetical protein [uncultured Bdellovibrio sp.]
MKKIFLSLLFLSTTQAFAVTDGKYKCDITPKGADKSKIQLSFEISNGDVVCKEADGEWCMRWFDFEPAKQEKFWLDGLYDGGYEDLDNGDWKVSADSDGCNIGKLILYKNSGFTKGFLTTAFHCSGKVAPSAGSVTCIRAK